MSLWASDNEWGIPTLDIRMQARVETPVCAWGNRARSAVMTGTWVFYVDDYRFKALLRQPKRILESKCVAAVEPNISVFDDSTRAEALWATYQKRTCAREWQEAGVRILVDLNVPERHMDLSLLGVPSGWTSYATRGYAQRSDALVREHAVAKAHGGPSATLLVYGGGSQIEQLCRTLPGAVWVPGHSEGARRLQRNLKGCTGLSVVAA